jgi:predicted SnoaL-like aldol condensation-catalyzing enzyme
MKKIISLFAIVALLASCGNDKTESSTSDTMSSDKKDNSTVEKNLAASRAVSDAFGSGNVSALDSIVADDFVDHTSTGDKKGRDSLKAMIAWVRATNKNMKMEIKKELADNDYVMTWMRFTGTSEGGMGMPAGPYDMTAIQLARFKDGKIVEHWEFMEPREMMNMMPGPPKPDDKSKK